jgi:hypothetical protein
MTSIKTSLQARDEAAARKQEAINGLRSVVAIRDEIYAAIDAELGQYPQYKDHGRTWDLGFITRTVTTKRGTAFKRGDVVLYHRNDDLRQHGIEGPTAYSVRNGIDTALDDDMVEPLAVETTYRHALGLVTFAE